MMKFYATCALQIVGLVIAGFVILGFVAMVIKAAGGLY